ncbi:hypothetical protein [Psychrobacter sp.]|uniref:hypothetical protein n=1 Tax=Psychrobacter sp. TaxID=56811 RepID=UPI003F973828
MIGHDIANLILKKTAISESFDLDNVVRSHPKGSIKQFILDGSELNTYCIENNQCFSIEVRTEDYSNALVSDYYCNKRIVEQKNNIKNLIDTNSQVAWILISMYYCNFYAANELSKLYGSFIVNFSNEDMKSILFQSQYTNVCEFRNSLQSYNSFRLEVAQSDYEGFTLLKFEKSSPKPHQAVWSNLDSIIRNLPVSDSLLHHYQLLQKILNSKKGWDNPSKTRNEWNYTNANYYAERGDRLGGQFKKIMNSSSSAFSWGNNRRVHPHDENKVASIAYIHFILLEAHDYINLRLGM